MSAAAAALIYCNFVSKIESPHYYCWQNYLFFLQLLTLFWLLSVFLKCLGAFAKKISVCDEMRWYCMPTSQSFIPKCEVSHVTTTKQEEVFWRKCFSNSKTTNLIKRSWAVKKRWTIIMLTLQKYIFLYVPKHRRQRCRLRRFLLLGDEVTTTMMIIINFSLRIINKKETIGNNLKNNTKHWWLDLSVVMQIMCIHINHRLNRHH